MENGLLTFEQMAYNNLMPWVNEDRYTGVFKELANYIDDAHAANHQVFFVSLINAVREIKHTVEPIVIAEWSSFARLSEFESLNFLVDELLAIKHYDPKVRFYTILASNCAKGALLTSANKTLHAESNPFTQYYINKTMQRLEEMIEPKQPSGEVSEVDLLIFKIIKLALLIVYIEIDKGFSEYIDRKQIKFSQSHVFEHLALIALNDKRLKTIAKKILHRNHSEQKKIKRNGNKRVLPLDELPNIFSSFNKANQSDILATHKRNHKKLHEELAGNDSAVGAKNGNIIVSEVAPRSDTFIGVGEVVKMMGKSRSTVKRWIEEKKIKPLPRSNNKEHYRFRLKDIEKLI